MPAGFILARPVPDEVMDESSYLRYCILVLYRTFMLSVGHHTFLVLNFLSESVNVSMAKLTSGTRGEPRYPTLISIRSYTRERRRD